MHVANVIESFLRNKRRWKKWKNCPIECSKYQYFKASKQLDQVIKTHRSSEEKALLYKTLKAFFNTCPRSVILENNKFCLKTLPEILCLMICRCVTCLLMFVKNFSLQSIINVNIRSVEDSAF